MKPILLLLVVVCLLVAAALCGNAPGPPSTPSILGGKRYVLITTPLVKPDYLTSEKFTAFIKPRTAPDGYREVIAGTPFADDMPVFKSMAADRTCKDDGSVTIGDGKSIIHSEPLPDTEPAAEKLIGRYAK